MKPMIETKETCTFAIRLLGNSIALKLYKRKHIKQILWLKEIDHISHIPLNEFGYILFSMDNRNSINGVYNGVDYLKILNIQFI